MKKCSVFFVAALASAVFTCNESPNGPGENPGGPLTLTTNASSTMATIRRIPDKTAYAGGDTVKLIAIANAGYTFTGWSGDTVTSAETLIIIMKTNKTMYANFRSNIGKTVFSVATAATNGAVVLTPAGGVYDSGATVIAKARADYGFKFVNWSGGLSGADTLATLVITRNISITAVFSVDPTAKYYTIRIQPFPAHGAILLDPEGVPNGNGFKYRPFTYVLITAKPDSSYEFAVWGGDLSNKSSPSVNQYIDTDLVVTATFSKTLPTPDLTGTWAFSGGTYMRGAVFGTYAFDPHSDTLVLRSDSTYFSNVKKSGSINGNYFGGYGSGTWRATKSSISFTYPLSQGFEYSLSGSSLDLTNGEMTLYASRLH